MSKNIYIITFYSVLFFIFCFLTNFASAQKKPTEPIILQIKNAKLPPVPFSHNIHAEKEKINCTVCHHKDRDVKNPKPCISCHPLKATGNGQLSAKVTFHKNCITCHKTNNSKGKTAPVKCNDCHKK